MVYWLLERQIHYKYVNNIQREGPAVLDAISKYDYQWIALTFVSVDDEDAAFARIVGGVCDVIKEQLWTVVVYWSLERKIYCTSVKNIQREGPAVR